MNKSYIFRRKSKRILDVKKYLSKTLVVYITIIFMMGTVLPSVRSDPNDPWWDTNWMYRKEINIDHTKVDANLKNFPVLINLSSDADLAAHVQPDGDDIVFTDALGNKLNHEIELFQSTTGRLVAWVNVTSLSSITDTRLYLYYNNSLSSSQQNPQGTWNADYLMVHHMNETGNIIDSTSHALNAVNYGTTAEPNGKIDGSRYFDSTTDRYDFGNASTLNPGLSSWTISLWTKTSYINNVNILQKYGSNTGFYLKMYNGASGYNYFQVSDGIKNTYRYWDASGTDGNWHYLTAVINRNTSTLNVYLDGTLHNGAGTGNIAGFGSITTASSFRMYGGTNGRHDEFTISTTVRNASWIKTCYNNQNNPASFYSIGSQEQAPSNNQPPIVSVENPVDNSVNVNINAASVSVTIQDPEGKHLNWTITTSPDIGSSVGTNEFNGTKTCAITGLAYSTIYTWTVKANDGSRWTNKTYSFATIQPPTPWWNVGWIYRKEININRTKVDANLKNFPVLINLSSDAGLADHTQPDGDDIVFTDAQGIKLNHEIELYTSATGRLVAWVNVTSLSSTTDTKLYLYYGNALCSSQQNPQGTWNADFLFVHHMNETGDIIDSTAHGLNGVNYGTTTEINGKIDGCRYFDNIYDRFDFGTASLLNPGLDTWTISLWTKTSYMNNVNILQKWGSGAGFFLKMYNNGAGGYNYFYLSDGTRNTYRYWDASGTDGNWHYLTIVINRNTNALDLYLDGVLHNGLSAGSLANLGSITTSAIFRMYGATNGRHDEFTLSTIARNASWIKTSYNNQYNSNAFYNLGSEELSIVNQAPILTNEMPQNGSINISIYQSSVSITIEDLEGDLFDWTIQGRYIINSSNIDDTAGIKTANLITPLPLNTDIIWYVNVTDPSGSGHWRNTTYYFTTKDITPTLKWLITSEVGVSEIGPLVADLTNDGQMEIIRSGGNGIAVYSGTTGALVWLKSMTMWDNHIPMEIIDLNKDGILEIICSYEYGTMALHGNNGSVYWYNPNALLQNKHPVAGDIDADGYPEVYVVGAGAQDGSIPGKITALTHDGNIFAITNNVYYPCWGGLSLGDTDQDGVFELYLNERGSNYWSGAGGVRSYWASNLTERWRMYNPNAITVSSHCPTLVDTNNDGILDVVSVTQGSNNNAIVYIFNSKNGVIIKTINTQANAHSQPTIYDIDGDGHLESITCRQLSRVAVVDLYTGAFETFLKINGNNILCNEPPAIADINGDGFVEILACTMQNISIFNHNYQFIGSIPLADSGVAGMAMIVAQDVDNDNLLELVLNRNDRLYVYNTVGAAPTPRALSQFNYYSPHRGRSPYYQTFGPLAPVIKNEKPINGTSNQNFNPLLSVYVYDYQNNLMNITFRTNASTGIWHTITTVLNVHEGTYTANPTEMNAASTTYWWNVTVTDSTGHTRTKVFKFTTRSESSWWNPAWNHRKAISIDHTKVDATFVNFPVLISLPSDMNLVTHAQQNGNDLVFTDTNGNKLNHEIELYQSATGRLVAWVNIPQLSSTVDTIIYLYYGNALCGSQQNPQGTWNSDYLFVHHMNETGAIIDSTTHGLNGVNYGTTTETNGKIDGCRYFDNLNDRYDFGTATSLNPGLNSWTISLWTKTSYVNNVNILQKWGSGAGFFLKMYNNGAGSNNYFYLSDGVRNTYRYWDSSGTDGNWHYLTIVINRNTNTLDLYLDGILHNGPSAGNLANLGSITTTSNFNFRGGTNGRHDEFTLSTIARNASWIKTSYNNQNGPSTFYSVSNEQNVTIPVEPVVLNESPQNGATNVPVYESQLLFTLQDYQDDSLSYTVTTSPYIGSASATGVGDGTYSVPVNGLEMLTIYTWYVNVTDGTHWTHEMFTFTTGLSDILITDVYPEHEATDIPLTPTLHITAQHINGYQMNITWKAKIDGTWSVIGTNNTVGNGTYYCSNTLWANTYSTLYDWKVEINDGQGNWYNKTFSFTTIAEPNLPPTQENPLLVSEFGTDTTDENLICSNQSTTDPNGDTVSNTYHWLRNSNSLTKLLLSFNTENQTNVKDYSGYNNNGTITGATWTSNGIVGGAYYFSGVDSQDRISIPHSSTLDGGGAWTGMTIEHWIYLMDDQTNSRTISKMASSGNSRSYQIGFQSANPNRLLAGVYIGSNSYKEVTYNTPLLTGQWYHVALTYNSGIGVKLYVNGVVVATIAGTGNIHASAGNNLYLGCLYGTQSFFDGKIDEVKIFPFALSPEQIYQNYLQSKDGFSTNSTIVAEETNIGDIWQCKVTPSDGQLDGLTKASNSLTIINP